jgi:hypothetical protein
MTQTGFIYDWTPRIANPCALQTSRLTGKERDAESGLDYFAPMERRRIAARPRARLLIQLVRILRHLDQQTAVFTTPILK